MVRKADTGDGGPLRSVRRCFQLLEHFDGERRPMAPTELAEVLEIPLSSMMDLLKCLSGIGYLAFDARTRHYYPTLRLGLLGEWLVTNPLDHSSYLDALTSLAETSQETVGVFYQNDTRMKCVAAWLGSHPISFNLKPGDELPMFGSAVGVALLARWSDEDIEKTYRRHVRRHGADGVPSLAECLADVREARMVNYAAGYDRVIPDVGAITAACPLTPDRWMVVSIAGVSKRIREHERDLAVLLLSALSATQAGSPER